MVGRVRGLGSGRLRVEERERLRGWEKDKWGGRGWEGEILVL